MYSSGLAYLLWVLSGFGALGFHRFYLGKPFTGLLWMFTGGLGMIGSIYDFFTLGRQVRDANMRLLLNSSAADRMKNAGFMRHVDDGEARILHTKDSVEISILRLARTNKGIITASEVALEARISIDDAKKHLEEMVGKGHAELRVRKSGTLVYVLPEFMENEAGSELEDF
jgi:hypothetical protein